MDYRRIEEINDIIINLFEGAIMKKALLFVFLTTLMVFSTLDSLQAQDIKIRKQVIGSGGMVGQTAGDVKMSGLFGQSIIGKRVSTGDPSSLGPFVHQGFWVPDGLITSVDEPDFSFNTQITNFPNPVNNVTNFKYSLETNSYVSLRVFDMLGNAITVFRDLYQSAGDQSYQWSVRDDNGIELSSGSYIYELVIQPAERTGAIGSPVSFRNVMVVVK